METYFGSPENKTEVETALEGIDCLTAFIREMGIGEAADYRSVADTSNIIINGCFKLLTHDDIYEIPMECRQ